jgi:hypothetical protein
MHKTEMSSPPDEKNIPSEVDARITNVRKPMEQGVPAVNPLLMQGGYCLLLAAHLLSLLSRQSFGIQIDSSSPAAATESKILPVIIINDLSY